MFRKRKQKQMLEEARRREAELERQKRSQISLEELQLLRDFRTSLIMPHLAKEFDILRSSSPENTIEEAPEPSTSEQKQTFQNVAPLSPPPRKPKAPVITNTPTGSAIQVSPWMEQNNQQYSVEQPLTPINESFEKQSTPSIYSTTSTLDSERSDQYSDQYRDLAAWRTERNKRHYSNQIFGGKQRLDHYRLAKEKSKTSLHDSTLPESNEVPMPVDKPLPVFEPEQTHMVEDLSVGEEKPAPPAVVDNVAASIFPKELTLSMSQPLKPLPTATRPKPRGRTRPDIRRYSIDPLSKWMDHTTTGYDYDQSLELNENFFFNDFAPDAENRRPRPKSRRMSKAAAKLLAENPTGRVNNPGKIDLAAIAKHLHENRLSVIQERKRISATEADEQELARLLADPQQANILEMHRDNALPKASQPPPTTAPISNEHAMSSAQAASAAIMRTRSASTSKVDKSMHAPDLSKPTGLTSSASMRISPLHSTSSGHAGNARPIHFLGRSRMEESIMDDTKDSSPADVETAFDNINSVEAPPHHDVSRKIQLNDKPVLSRAGSTVDRSPSTRLAAIQGIQKHLRQQSVHKSQPSSEGEADTQEDESLDIIEEIPTTPISEEEPKLFREQSTSTPINLKSRKDKPRIALLDSATPDVSDPAAFVSPRSAPAPPTDSTDSLANKDMARSGSKLHDDRKFKPSMSRSRTKSSNDTDEEDGKSGFLQFRRQVSKLRRPRAGSESGTPPKLSGLKHAVSNDAMNGLSSYSSVENIRDAKSSRLVNISDSATSSTNEKLALPNNGQPRRSISMREIRSPSMESDDPFGSLRSKQPKTNGEDDALRSKNLSHDVLHRPTASISSSVSGSSDERFSSFKHSGSGRSNSEDSAGSPQLAPRNPLRHSRDESGKSRSTISRSGSARVSERISHEHKVVSPSKLKEGDNSPRSHLGNSKLTPAALIAMKHSEDVKDNTPARIDTAKRVEKHTSGPKGIRMLSQLLGKSGKKNSTKRVNGNIMEPNRARGQESPPTDVRKSRSSARSQVVRRTIIYVQPEDVDDQTGNPMAYPSLNSIQERTSLSSDSSHINSPDSDTGYEYVTAKVITRQPSLKKTVVDAEQPKAATSNGLTRKGTNGRKWRLENVDEETVPEPSVKPTGVTDNETLPRSSTSSSVPRSSYDNDSIYKFYNSRQSTSDRSLDSVQRASMRSAAHAQLEGLEVREMSDGSVVYGVVKKHPNGRRTSMLLPTNQEHHPVETEILTSDEDEDEIEERVLQLMGFNPDSPRLSDFMNGDRRSKKTSKDIAPSRSSERSPQHRPPPQYPPPPIPTRSPRRMASIKQQQQLKPKVSRVQDHRAKHISTISTKSPDGGGATTDIYIAEEVTLSGLLDMIKDTADVMDDYYGDYYSDQTYFPDSDTEAPSDRMPRSATVEEKLDDALKTWEQSSSSREHPHFR
ncbi:hypothetical protein K450DRAFT_226643 [Umbelopsis ramanniana AG]|uniref:Uncharacterized protein n=1 Tax=Umbelopsis ramanniana AG TaxID=1314678 RepID=A0AAD5EF48_UMBRA|nr:uncharacterized protein K450DRAFT_226643 [Umbelopsis ramanniana AG]KAI8582733.1 hypothetical protein K450DRAFT_226643 [Umbelopsis ramanniana AG]